MPLTQKTKKIFFLIVKKLKEFTNTLFFYFLVGFLLFLTTNYNECPISISEIFPLLFSKILLFIILISIIPESTMEVKKRLLSASIGYLPVASILKYFFVLFIPFICSTFTFSTATPKRLSIEFKETQCDVSFTTTVFYALRIEVERSFISEYCKARNIEYKTEYAYANYLYGVEFDTKEKAVLFSQQNNSIGLFFYKTPANTFIVSPRSSQTFFSAAQKDLAKKILPSGKIFFLCPETPSPF